MKRTHLEFKEILKLRREKLGKSQLEVGRAVDLKSGVSCSDWERGDGLPESKRLQQLARYLGLTVGQLFGEYEIPANMLFKDAAHAAAEGFNWEDPVPPAPPKPFEPKNQEPGRFLMFVNLEGCELLTILHQLDSRARRTLLGQAEELLRGSEGPGK